MKHFLFIPFVLLAVGCASVSRDADRTYTVRGPAQGSNSTALVFDPVVTAYAPNMDLDRSNRQASAFVGFDSVITTTYTRTDDHQFYDAIGGGRGGYSANLGYLDRQSYTETVAVRQK